MPTGIYKRTEQHLKQLAIARKHIPRKPLTEQTKQKIGAANRGIWIPFVCNFCGKACEQKQSRFYKKKRHFCSMKCYADFQRELLPKEEHNSYGHGNSIEERQHRKWCRSVLNHAVRDGLITKRDCEICGRKAQAHHDDYSKPLDVQWLCFYHHRKLHNQKIVCESPELLKETK